MANTNNFKAFALDPNANVTSQADWEALPALLSGFTAGKASSAQVNKAIRQATTIGALIGQFIANSGVDALDNADVNGLVTKFTNALTTNLSLGSGSKMPAASALFSSAGYLSLPVIVSGIQRTLIVQWKTVTIPQNTGNFMTTVDADWPIPFPTACLSLIGGMSGTTYDNRYTPYSGVGNKSRTQFTVASAYSASSSNVTAWGVGY